MQRSIAGEVIASTFDMPTEDHIQVSELVIERAKRPWWKWGKTSLFCLTASRVSHVPTTWQRPRAAASCRVALTLRHFTRRSDSLVQPATSKGGGSLTILASALIETGSKMDEVIFEEFKGTGNMELKLDRSLADRRIFPAIDPIASGTRREDLLLDPQEAPVIWAVRRILANMNNTERAHGYAHQVAQADRRQ